MDLQNVFEPSDLLQITVNPALKKMVGLETAVIIEEARQLGLTKSWGFGNNLNYEDCWFFMPFHVKELQRSCLLFSLDEIQMRIKDMGSVMWRDLFAESWGPEIFGFNNKDHYWWNSLSADGKAIHCNVHYISVPSKSGKCTSLMVKHGLNNIFMEGVCSLESFRTPAEIADNAEWGHHVASQSQQFAI